MRSRLGTALMGVACSIAIVLTGTACDDNDDNSKALAAFNGHCTVNSATMLYAVAGGPHQINWCFSQNEQKLVKGAGCNVGDINCIYNAVAAHTPHGYGYAGMFEKNGKPGGVMYFRSVAGQTSSVAPDDDDSDAHKKRKRRKRSNVRQPKKVNPPPVKSKPKPVKPPRTSHR